MKKIFVVLVMVLGIMAIRAQDEAITPLGYNPVIYHTAKAGQSQNNTHRYLIDKGITVVSTDTLTLPFIDDFSRNNLGTLHWVQNHITDTFYNVTGTCLAVEGVTLLSGRYMTTPSYTYSYDTATHTVDSTAKPVITFTFFGPATSGCFTQTPSTLNRWEEYYTFHFDSLGRKLDSTLVVDETNHPSEIIFYAPVIYFAQGEPGKLWFDNYAYVNNTYPVNPPTIGVATLDGLNEYGLPYNSSSNSTYGTADYLTSKPINLSGLSDADSVYLSFFYEPKGLGDYPDKDDSLLLEFRDNSSEWRTVWSDTGYASLAGVNLKFKQVLIQVPALVFPYTYFHNTFQFRFRNKASLYGNNDHWHIDYVELDKNRSNQDTLIQDIAFIYPFPTVLKNYTLMPADQFVFPTDLRDTLILPVHNLDPNAITNPPATNFVKSAEEWYPSPVVISAPLLQTFNASDYSYIQVNPSSEYTIPNTPNWPVDSLVLNATVFIEPNDSRKLNDTLTRIQHFDNTFAYDDGSAEMAYGLTGVGLKKFAYEFSLNQPDTLVGFQVQYSQVEEAVNDLIFSFEAWDSLKLNDYTFDDAATNILTMENKKPYYIDSVNGFTSYKLDTPLIVASKVYFGWAQTDSRRLQVGYDLNSTLGRAHMLIYANGKWALSGVTTNGSPMIRLIFDSNYWGGTSAIREMTNAEDNISVYPNPTTGMLFIKSEEVEVKYRATLVDLLGNTVKQEDNIQHRFDLNGLPTGVYILALHNQKNGNLSYRKIIKTH